MVSVLLQSITLYFINIQLKLIVFDYDFFTWLKFSNSFIIFLKKFIKIVTFFINLLSILRFIGMIVLLVTHILKNENLMNLMQSLYFIFDIL